MRVAPVGVEAELLGLTGSRLAELRAPVARVYAEERRQAVEVTVVVLVVDIGSLPLDDQRDLVALVVPAHAGEVHPQVPASLLLQVARRSALARPLRLWGVVAISSLLAVKYD